MRSFKVSVVVPGYNEADNIPTLIHSITAVLSAYKDYEIIYVDDGSTDNSIAILEALNKTNNKINFISLSRNFGHQSALKAGLDYAKSDCVISMDADMQHPPALIPEMIAKWQEGFDIVYTKRAEDRTLPWLKRRTSSLFYKLMNYFSDVKIEEGTADFRLVDQLVVQAFRNMNENDLFIRGLIKWLGFRQYCIDYQPSQRFAGTSKYSLRKMFSFALKGITSFSIKPLRFATIIGFALSFLAFSYGLYAVYIHFFTGLAISGWTSVIMSILFIGGIQLVILGIIGEYLGKLFIQAKNRPLYVIKTTSLDPAESSYHPL